MELDLTQRQGQTLSPQMIQSAAVLQMAAQELGEYLETVLQENPVLELEESFSPPDAGDDLRRKLEWLESNDPQNREYHWQDAQADADPLRNCGATGREQESLYHYLRLQLEAMRLDRRTAECARLLAASLNQNGWLDEELSALALETGQPVSAIERALEVVQSLDPAGVAARNLTECLRLQLVRQGPRLHNPDIVVSGDAGHFELAYNDRLFPTLNISSYYTKLLRESDDEQVRDYLAGKLRQAKWTIRAVDQRKTTLTVCVQCIVEAQEDFFRLGEGHLKPLSLADIARRVGLHESTVSRAVSGKYLQCPRGTYPLSYFFSRRLGPDEGGKSISADGAKSLLKELIEGEDRRKPLSDQKLCERMAAKGCVLSRRTVAKYRDELGIPGTGGRKRG